MYQYNFLDEKVFRIRYPIENTTWKHRYFIFHKIINCRSWFYYTLYQITTFQTLKHTIHTILCIYYTVVKVFNFQFNWYIASVNGFLKPQEDIDLFSIYQISFTLSLFVCIQISSCRDDNLTENRSSDLKKMALDVISNYNDDEYI